MREDPPPPKPAREIRLVESNTVALFDTARFEHMQRIANVMALASLIPDHLKGKGREHDAHNVTVANCFMVINQAQRWNVDPFSIAPETYVVAGKLGYQGKLIAAIVNSRAGLKRNLDYTFEGSGDERTVTVIGEFEREDKARTITLQVKDAKTDNKMWVKDPDQKLVYSGSTKWARRYCPEVLLGVLTDDDLDLMRTERELKDVTPPRPQRSDYNGVTGAPAKAETNVIDVEATPTPVAEDTPPIADKPPAEAERSPSNTDEAKPAARRGRPPKAAGAGMVAASPEQPAQTAPEPSQAAPTIEWELVDTDGVATEFETPLQFANAISKLIAQAGNNAAAVETILESNDFMLRQLQATNADLYKAVIGMNPQQALEAKTDPLDIPKSLDRRGEVKGDPRPEPPPGDRRFF